MIESVKDIDALADNAYGDREERAPYAAVGCTTILAIHAVVRRQTVT
jgi:hypothetical protein